MKKIQRTIKDFYFKMLNKLIFNKESYDFVDFGSKMGSSMNYAVKKLGGRKGLGIEIKPAMVAEAKKNGHDVILGDVTKLNLPDKFVRFTVISHFLEHLANKNAVKDAIGSAVRISREFIYIRGPVFDDCEYLEKLGYKVFWSDWPNNHTCHLTTDNLKEILKQLGIKNYKINFEVEINDSTSRNIHPINSPSYQHEFDSSKHPPKKYFKFEKKLYREFVCIINL